MSTPTANSYMAEILRHVHDVYAGELRDDKVGITRRLWNELGQKAGVHFASVSAALSALERNGCIATEFGVRQIGGRARTACIILEEPPEGVTIFKGEQQRLPHPQDDDDDNNLGLGRYPTAEEVAKELLALALKASQLPLTDIAAARHHNECLREEIDAWVEVAEEADARAAELAAQLTQIVAEQDISRADTETFLRLDGMSTRVTRLERLLQGSRRRTAYLAQDRDDLLLALAVANRNTELGNIEIEKAQAAIDEKEAALVGWVRYGDESRRLNQQLAETVEQLQLQIDELKVALTRSDPALAAIGFAGFGRLEDEYRASLDRLYPTTRIGKRAVQPDGSLGPINDGA